MLILVNITVKSRTRFDHGGGARIVLSREIGEFLVIDDEIVIRVVDIRNSCIRLGIEAPSHVHVFRNELTEPRHIEPLVFRFPFGRVNE